MEAQGQDHTATAPRRDRRRRAALTEQVIVDSFWKNRSGQAVRVTLSTFETVNLFDVREFFTNKDGVLCPSKKGIACNILRLPEMIAALQKAQRKAIELGLLKDEAGH